MALESRRFKRGSSHASINRAGTGLGPNFFDPVWWRRTSSFTLATIGIISLRHLWFIPSALSTTVLEFSQNNEPKKIVDGIYLFGDSQQAGQMGQQYMVIEIKGQIMTGGFYEPFSEFRCFTGRISATEMNLDVEAADPAQTQNYRIPLPSGQPLDSTPFFLPFDNGLGRLEANQIEDLDAESQKILLHCQDQQADFEQLQTIPRLPESIILPSEGEAIGPVEVYWGE